SCITPPIGMNLFAVVGASRGKVSIREVYSGVLPFVILELLILALLLAFPSITLMLPSAMIG
ncbi:MAG: TRAP transporter large permease subunit, partial [Pseudomonadota bacterium]|nr:TRAP transporter large permease subunit [Pseudomonadota bacterium]